MYITKMVFVEEKDIEPIIENYSIISYTDYGTREILAQNIRDYRENLDSTEEKEFEQDLEQYLGSDVLNALISDEIDFILVV